MARKAIPKIIYVPASTWSEKLKTPAIVYPVPKTHKHKCPRCNLVWEHPDNCGGWRAISTRMCHTCPRCACHRMLFFEPDTYVKYFGRKTSDIIFLRAHRFDEVVAEMLKGL